jgi:hypothetical protein
MTEITVSARKSSPEKLVFTDVVGASSTCLVVVVVVRTSCLFDVFPVLTTVVGTSCVIVDDRGSRMFDAFWASWLVPSPC